MPVNPPTTPTIADNKMTGESYGGVASPTAKERTFHFPINNTPVYPQRSAFVPLNVPLPQSPHEPMCYKFRVVTTINASTITAIPRRYSYHRCNYRLTTRDTTYPYPAKWTTRMRASSGRERDHKNQDV
jgi:hypothetical protein